MTTPDALLARRRIVGIDLARFAAILGMMAAHLVRPGTGVGAVDDAASKLIGATISSTSATTFAVLGGFSLVLLSRSMRGRSTGRMLVSILLRGLLISLLGFALEQLNGPISVVLTAYGVAMILAAPALLMPSWAVAGIAGVLWLFGGAVNAGIRSGLAPLPASPDLSDVVPRFLLDLVLTGHYPAITWVAYMLTGILLARLMLSITDRGALRRLCVRMLVVGAILYIGITAAGRIVRMRPGWFGLPDLGERMLSSGYGAPIGTDFWMLLIPTPHSGNPADMLRTVAGACLLIGLLVLLFDVLALRGGFVLATVRAAGAAPLTIYTAHVIVTAALQARAIQAVSTGEATWPVWYAQGLGILLLQLVGVLAIGAVLTLLHRRGPLEALLGWLSGSSRRRTPQVSPAAV